MQPVGFTFCIPAYWFEIVKPECQSANWPYYRMIGEPCWILKGGSCWSSKSHFGKTLPPKENICPNQRRVTYPFPEPFWWSPNAPEPKAKHQWGTKCLGSSAPEIGNLLVQGTSEGCDCDNDSTSQQDDWSAKDPREKTKREKTNPKPNTIPLLKNSCIYKCKNYVTCFVHVGTSCKLHGYVQVAHSAAQNIWINFEKITASSGGGSEPIISVYKSWIGPSLLSSALKKIRCVSP